MGHCDLMWRTRPSEVDPTYCGYAQSVTDCRTAVLDAVQEERKLAAEKAQRDADRLQGQKDKADAARLAKELGVADPSSEAGAASSSAAADRQGVDIQTLAQELGVSTTPSSRSEYSADQLAKDLQNWDASERARVAAEEERKRQWEEQQRVELAKREEIMREQTASREQQEAEERQHQILAQEQASHSDSPDTGGSGLFSTIVAQGIQRREAEEISGGLTPAQHAKKLIKNARTV